MNRVSFGDGTRDRLKYAQVYEDPLLEVETLLPTEGRNLMVVSSGGCTALSLLAAGAGRVTAVDFNATQNDLVELKVAAVTRLGPQAVAFLGGAPSDPTVRLSMYRNELRQDLTDAARQYWDAEEPAIRAGVLGSGSAERYGAVARRALRLLVHPGARIERMLGCRTLDDQRDVYTSEWDTARWRALFRVLFGRLTFRGAFWGPEVGSAARSGAFAEHFRRRFERSLTEMPVADNYFLHYLLDGRYPTDGLPPYLADRSWTARGGLALADGTVTAWLRAQPDRSVHGFGLSNIIEWLPASEVDPLWTEIVRTAAPGARLCYRNLLGWTEVPARWRESVVERPESSTLFDRDRSTLQRRFVVCDVRSHAA